MICDNGRGTNNITWFAGSLSMALRCRKRRVEDSIKAGKVLRLKSAFATVLPALRNFCNVFNNCNPSILPNFSSCDDTVEWSRCYTQDVRYILHHRTYLISPTIPDTLRRLANMGFTNLGGAVARIRRVAKGTRGGGQ